MIDLDRIMAASMKAGGRAWYCDGVTNDGLTMVTDCVHGSNMFPVTAETSEAQFIEAASPAVVLEMIAWIKALQHSVELLDGPKKSRKRRTHNNEGDEIGGDGGGLQSAHPACVA